MNNLQIFYISFDLFYIMLILRKLQILSLLDSPHQLPLKPQIQNLIQTSFIKMTTYLFLHSARILFYSLDLWYNIFLFGIATDLMDIQQ